MEIARKLAAENDLDFTAIYLHMMGRYEKGAEVFQDTIEHFQLKRGVQDLLTWYREHLPDISLTSHASYVLKFIKNHAYKIGLITDGRSLQQRNKIKSLGLDNFFDEIIISEEFGSEKPEKGNFLHFTELYGDGDYWYIGDNTSKDFIAPNLLGWGTICLVGDERNIHPQNFDKDRMESPKYFVTSLKDVLDIIKFPSASGHKS
ncbi:hypothetical protein GCM10011361_04890 [Muriicola marianensis]|uniref:HAD family hydrolase n=2 Tax=Muriicola marianensis TaxID=1324801 RepID=A0ABQ1QQB6_9FLAO|nr:hypothetical protein GCM10011361_04890 [Muriicola marianensis]